MNWGRGIIIVFVLFAAFIFYIAYSSMTTHFDLVSDEYYKEEIEYQKVIDSKQNDKNLKSQISLKVEDQKVKILLPDELKENPTSGKIHFYSVLNAKRDQQFPLTFDQNGEQVIQVDKFVPGNYTAKISYTNSGQDYYTEIPVKL